MVRLLTQAAIQHSPFSLLGGAGDTAETEYSWSRGSETPVPRAVRAAGGKHWAVGVHNQHAADHPGGESRRFLETPQEKDEAIARAGDKEKAVQAEAQTEQGP